MVKQTKAKLKPIDLRKVKKAAKQITRSNIFTKVNQSFGNKSSHQISIDYAGYNDDNDYNDNYNDRDYNDECSDDDDNCNIIRDNNTNEEDDDASFVVKDNLSNSEFNSDESDSNDDEFEAYKSILNESSRLDKKTNEYSNFNILQCIEEHKQKHDRQAEVNKQQFCRTINYLIKMNRE
jgi:hypothetical protein